MSDLKLGKGELIVSAPSKNTILRDMTEKLTSHMFTASEVREFTGLKAVLDAQAESIDALRYVTGNFTVSLDVEPATDIKELIKDL